MNWEETNYSVVTTNEMKKTTTTTRYVDPVSNNAATRNVYVYFNVVETFNFSLVNQIVN